MSNPETLEVWLRGPRPDVPPLLQPVAHALLQAREELTAAMRDFPSELLNERPAGVASVGFHWHFHSAAKRGAETFQQRDVVDIEVHAQLLGFHQLLKRHAVGRKQNIVGGETHVQAQPHFVDAHAVEPRAQAVDR